MKKIFGMISILCLGLLIVLTGCKNKQDNLPKVEGVMEVIPFKTYVTVKTRFVDTEEHDLYYDKVNVIVRLFVREDDEETFRESKDVTINKPSVDKDEENPTIDRNMTGNSVDFSSLKENTDYVVKLMLSSNGVQQTIETKSVTTINNGKTEDDPIIITSLDLLIGMNKERDAYYKLGNDIDCGGDELPSIFSSSAPFTGHFNGDGKKISNFKLYANSYTGLFGYMKGATVENLNIENVNYDQSRTDTHLGVLSGYANNCKISNIQINQVRFNHSSTSSRTGWIGGLVGRAENCKITDCKITDLEIKIPRAQLKIYVGGFMGYNASSEIKNCSVEGNVEATVYYNSYDDGCVYAGGFVGVNDSISGIEDCYAKVNLTISEPASVSSTGYKTHKLYVGGFLGGNISNMSMLKNCAIIGQVKVSAEYSFNTFVGGFAGVLNEQNASRLENCLFYPTGDGLVVTLAAKKEDSSTDSDENENEDEENKDEKTQVAYVSLTVAKIGETSSLVNTIVYKELYKLENQHDKTTFTLGSVSEDLSLFSDTIKNLFV